MDPSASQKPEADLRKVGQSPTSSTSPSAESPESKKQNWLTSWLKNQVKAFNPGLLIMGIKGALPPIIFLAMFENDVVADYFGSLGYLIAIISSLTFAMMPRGKFIESVIRHIFFACLAVPVTIFGLWCCRQAKLHTQSPGSTDLYNSSAAAVAATFLFFSIFAINSFRARYPKLMLSVVMYAIITNVSFTMGYFLPDSLPVWYLPKALLVDFLVSYALALGVNVLFFPVTSRTVFMRSFEANLRAASGLLETHSTFIEPPNNFLEQAPREMLTKAKDTYRSSFVKLTTDKHDAKREFAYGILSSDHLSDLHSLSRKVAWPLMGAGTVGNIITEIKRTGILDPNGLVQAEEITDEDIRRALKYLERPCQLLNLLCREGIEHILCCFGMGKYAKPSGLSRLFGKKLAPRDDETASDIGTDAFINRFDIGIQTFRTQKLDGLDQFFDEKRAIPSQALFLVLFVEFLLFATAEEIRNLIVYVDNLRNTGELKRNKFRFPKLKHFQKSLARVFHARKAEDLGGEGFGAEDGDVYTTPAFTGRTQQTSLEPATNSKPLLLIFSILTSISSFFRSEYATFGFRAACATFAGTIPAFLRNSYEFFVEYRGVWITITVILGMSPTTGASLNGLFMRCLGTVVGGIIALVVWYVVVGKSAGVVVLSLVALAPHYYFFLQDPRRIRPMLSSYTTFLLVIGYALEVQKIGIPAIETSGQPYLPTYKLAPYRILVTIIGVILAFIFTIFPYPVTSRDILRQDIARQFHLLSNMYSLTQTRMRRSMKPGSGDDLKGLRKVMEKVGYKCIAVQARCMENLAYTSWEPDLHVKFPKKTYAELLGCMQSLFELYIIQNDAISRMSGTWINTIINSLGIEFFQSQSHLTLSLLNILSGSLSLDTPLPPYLNSPTSISFRKLVKERLPEELKLEYVGERGYAVFAALAVASRLANREVERCVELVRNLVGEVDLQWELEEVKKEN